MVDCPMSHLEVKSALSKLRDVTCEINRAMDDPRFKLALEKTLILQDRLLFPDQVYTMSNSMTLANSMC